MVTDANTKLAYSRAQERAKSADGASRVTDLGGGKYSVLSSGEDNFYTVTVIERERQHIYLCGCVAGQKGTSLCWHRGATMLYRVREAMLLATIAAGRGATGEGARVNLCMDCGAAPATFIRAANYPSGPGRCGDCHNAEMARREVCTYEGCAERPTHTERIMGEGRWVCETHRQALSARSTSARAAIWPEAY